MEWKWDFEAVIRCAPDQDAAYVVMPFDLRKETGKGRMKVHALFDGEPYDGSIVNMGLRDGQGQILYLLGMPKALRRRLGKTAGDRVRLRLRERE